MSEGSLMEATGHLNMPTGKLVSLIIMLSHRGIERVISDYSSSRLLLTFYAFSVFVILDAVNI